jgi:hypothetical protein
VADNVVSSAGTFATDDVGGVHYPIEKIAFGPLDTVTLVTSSDPFPVTMTTAVSLSSQATVTAIFSSQPTVTVAGAVSISSGVVSLSSQITVTSVMSSQQTVTVSGPVSVTSGIVTLSSVHTVTATAATNPWSSAPGFNMPVVAASSGLTQISGTVVVLSASSGLVQISGTPTVLTASSGLVQISGTVGLSTAAAANLVQLVTSSAGSIVATTSQGILISQSTNVLVPANLVTTAGTALVATTSQGVLMSQSTSVLVPALLVSSAGVSGASMKYSVLTTVTKVSSSPGVLYALNCYATLATITIVRVYDATSSSVVVGTSVKGAVACPLYTTGVTAPTGMPTGGISFGPFGVAMTSGICLDAVLISSSTAAVATNATVTTVYV